MGISASFGMDAQRDLFFTIGEGDLQRVKLLLSHKPTLVNRLFFHGLLFPLHYAASHGQSDVLLLLLDSGAMVDSLNSYKQTPLMLACKNGRMACVDHLVERGANVLMFDALRERTCLHHIAKSGHTHCLQRILNAAQASAVAQTWGFARFINVRDGSGATPLHLAARSRHSPAVRLLLSSGALVCATTTKSSRSSLSFGSSPLHFAARGGSTECVKELLAWGADRLQRNSQGHTPFSIAMKYHQKACAALLNPSTAEPLVWPSPWKFMSNLDPEAKVLLEAALAQANDAWERRIFSASSKVEAKAEEEEVVRVVSEAEDDDEELGLCCICFEHACTIEVEDCGHRMCAGCTLALCCHNKPNPTVSSALAPVPACPFCRRNIQHLKRAPIEAPAEPGTAAGGVEEQGREGNGSTKVAYTEELGALSTSINVVATKPGDNGSSSSSFKGLVSKGSFRLLSSARVADIDWHKESSSAEETRL